MKLFTAVLGLFFLAATVRASYFLDQLRDDEEIEIAYHQDFTTDSQFVEHLQQPFNCSMFVYRSSQADDQYVVRFDKLYFAGVQPDQSDQHAFTQTFKADFNRHGRWAQIHTTEADTEWSIKLKSYLIGLINDNSKFFDKYLVLSTVGFEIKNEVDEHNLKCSGVTTTYEISPYSYINFILKLTDDQHQVKRDYNFTVTFNSLPSQLEAAEQTATTTWADGRFEQKYFESKIVQFTPIHTGYDGDSLSKIVKGRERKEQQLFLGSFERCQGIP